MLELASYALEFSDKFSQSQFTYKRRHRDLTTVTKRSVNFAFEQLILHPAYDNGTIFDITIRQI